MKYQNSLRPPGRTCGPADTSIVIQTAWFVNPSEWLLQLAAARHDLRAQHAAVRHIDLVLQIDRRANMHRDRLQHIADLQLRHRPLRRDHAVLLRQAADAQLGILREPGVALKEIRRLIQLRDVLSNQKPYIFVKHFYACPTLIGALLCALCWRHLGDIPSMLLGAAVILVLRLCAAHFRWGLPHAADLPE